MSTRTIIEINHDYLPDISLTDMLDLFRSMSSSDVTGELNRANGKPVQWSPGIVILAQRHHSETVNLEVK